MPASEMSRKFHKSNKNKLQWETLQCLSRSFPALAVLRWPRWLTSHRWQGACQKAAFAQTACCRCSSEGNFNCGGAATKPELFFFKSHFPLIKHSTYEHYISIQGQWLDTCLVLFSDGLLQVFIRRQFQLWRRSNETRTFVFQISFFIDKTQYL